MKIQIDLDGVLVNIYKELDNRIRDKFPELDFTCNKYITSWSMKELNRIDERISKSYLSVLKVMILCKIYHFIRFLDGLNILDNIIYVL